MVSGGGALKTRGRPWPRERVDGACARRDGAKRKVFKAPPPETLTELIGFDVCTEDDRDGEILSYRFAATGCRLPLG